MNLIEIQIPNVWQAVVEVPSLDYRIIVQYEISAVIYLSLGAVHKRGRNFFAIFDTPLPHVGILTLIDLTSTF